MILTGSLINGIAVLLGGILGTLVGKWIPKRIGTVVLQGLALCVLMIGVEGALEGNNALIAIISITVGVIIGEIARLQHHMDRFGLWIQQKVSKGNDESSVAEGFVSCGLLVCVGAMAITGSLDAGLKGDHTVLLAKSLIDAISSFVMASTLGIGVALAGVLVFLYEGAITLFAGFVAPFISENMMAEMTCVGSLLIIAIALNMMGLTKIKVLNFLPAVVLPVLLCPLFG